MDINDINFRQNKFYRATSALKKLINMQKYSEDFAEIDQLLFENWHAVTFKIENEKLLKIKNRKKQLENLKSHILYFVEINQVSFPEALNLLAEEQLQYQNGDAEWKYIIERLREQRITSARNYQEKSKLKALNEPTSHSSLFDIYTHDDLESDPPQRSNLYSLDRKNRLLYHFSQECNDCSLSSLLNDRKTGYRFFKNMFELAMKCGDWKLVGRIIRNTNQDYQKKIFKNFPLHFIDFINQLTQETNKGTASKVNQTQQNKNELEAKYKEILQKLESKKRQTSSNLKTLKFTDNLIRECQDAFERMDFYSLLKVENLTILHSGEFEEMTEERFQICMDELSERSKTLRRKVFNQQRHPAWRFSDRRDYGSLTQRLRHKINREIQDLEKQVQDLETWFEQIRAEYL